MKVGEMHTQHGIHVGAVWCWGNLLEVAATHEDPASAGSIVSDDVAQASVHGLKGIAIDLPSTYIRRGRQTRTTSTTSS